MGITRSEPQLDRQALQTAQFAQTLQTRLPQPRLSQACRGRESDSASQNLAAPEADGGGAMSFDAAYARNSAGNAPRPALAQTSIRTNSQISLSKPEGEALAEALVDAYADSQLLRWVLASSNDRTRDLEDLAIRFAEDNTRALAVQAEEALTLKLKCLQAADLLRPRPSPSFAGLVDHFYERAEMGVEEWMLRTEVTMGDEVGVYFAGAVGTGADERVDVADAARDVADVKGDRHGAGGIGGTGSFSFTHRDACFDAEDAPPVIPGPSISSATPSRPPRSEDLWKYRGSVGPEELKGLKDIDASAAPVTPASPGSPQSPKIIEPLEVEVMPLKSTVQQMSPGPRPDLPYAGSSSRPSPGPGNRGLACDSTADPEDAVTIKQASILDEPPLGQAVGCEILHQQRVKTLGVPELGSHTPASRVRDDTAIFSPIRHIPPIERVPGSSPAAEVGAASTALPSSLSELADQAEVALVEDQVEDLGDSIVAIFAKLPNFLPELRGLLENAQLGPEWESIGCFRRISMLCVACMCWIGSSEPPERFVPIVSSLALGIRNSLSDVVVKSGNGSFLSDASLSGSQGLSVVELLIELAGMVSQTNGHAEVLLSLMGCISDIVGAFVQSNSLDSQSMKNLQQGLLFIAYSPILVQKSCSPALRAVMMQCLHFFSPKAA